MSYAKLILLALVALTLTSCAGMTAAETAGVAVGIGASVVELANVVVPHLSAEDGARVVEMAKTSSGWMDLLGKTMGQVAQAAESANQRAALAEANGVDMSEVLGVSAAAGGGGTVVGRYLSHLKHSAGKAS